MAKAGATAGGPFTVSATSGGVTGTASVTVAKPGVTPPPIIEPPIEQEPTSLSWEGQVPAQKWMNFYTKVLSKFASSKDLQLKVRVQVEVEVLGETQPRRHCASSRAGRRAASPRSSTSSAQPDGIRQVMLPPAARAGPSTWDPGARLAQS